jgi:hypothetical protein
MSAIITRKYLDKLGITGAHLSDEGPIPCKMTRAGQYKSASSSYGSMRPEILINHRLLKNMVWDLSTPAGIL